MKCDYILTVIIPVHNRERIVLSALDSIADKRCNNRVKVIVIDDNSTDLTFDVVKDWISLHDEMNVSLIRTDVKGSSGARNRGLAEVDTEFTMFFDSDDRMMPGFLSSVVASLDMTAADIVGWDVNFTGKGKPRRIFSAENVWMNHLVHGALSTQRYVARTSIFRTAGGWNEKLEAWTDYELGVRLLGLNPKIEKLSLDYRKTVEVNYTNESITDNASKNPERWIRALDVVEHSLKILSPRDLGWIQYRRAILAAAINGNGQTDIARNELKKAIDGSRIPANVVKMIYCLHHIFGRGTWLIASLYC